MEAKKFDIDGFRVLIKEEELHELEDINFVECSNIIESECPVVAEGDWTENGIWLFFRTYDSNSNYSFEFDEFMEAVKKGREEFQ